MNDIYLPAGEFKATCLKLMDEVAATGKSVTITKRGKAVARLVPAQAPSRKAKSLFGALAHITHIVGDIDGPSAYTFEAQMAETVREWDEVQARLKAAQAARKTKAAPRRTRS